jgi:hypothetical protein
VSETILDHGYVPEEHAPDPVIGHGDPTPPGKVAIWLFLASEVMFFVAILGSYIILRSGSPQLFSKFGATLSIPLAGLNTLVLIFSSLTMALAVDASQKGLRNRLIVCLAITFVCACGFMVIKAIEYHDKWTHYTIAYRADSASTELFVIDGHLHHQDAQMMTVEGYVLPAAGGVNVHLLAESDLKDRGATKQEVHIPKANIIAQLLPVEEHLFLQLLRADRSARASRCRRDAPDTVPDDLRAPRPVDAGTHGVRRPLLALRRSGLDLPVPVAVPHLVRR